MQWDSGLQRFRPEDSAAASPSFRCAALFTLMSSNISEGSFSPRRETSEGDEEGEEKRKKKVGGEKNHTGLKCLRKRAIHIQAERLRRPRREHGRRRSAPRKITGRNRVNSPPPQLPPALLLPSGLVCGALISRDSKITEKLIDLLSNLTPHPHPSGETCKHFHFRITPIPSFKTIPNVSQWWNLELAKSSGI